MIATYKLNTKDLTSDLIKLIKKSFPGKEIEITIQEQDATEYLKSNTANEQSVNEAVARIEKREKLVKVYPTSLKRK